MWKKNYFEILESYRKYNSSLKWGDSISPRQYGEYKSRKRRKKRKK